MQRKIEMSQKAIEAVQFLMDHTGDDISTTIEKVLVSAATEISVVNEAAKEAADKKGDKLESGDKVELTEKQVKEIQDAKIPGQKEAADKEAKEAADKEAKEAADKEAADKKPADKKPEKESLGVRAKLS